MASKKDRRVKSTILIRKEEVVEGEAHGGSWKVAYADFVTAMMAFFLLMWLLNATTEDQRKGLADYFSPNSVMSQHSSGSGQPFGGKTAFSEGAMVSDNGAAQVTVGQRPVVDVTDPDDSSDVVAQPRPHREDVKSNVADQGGKLAAKAPPPPPRPANATDLRRPTGETGKAGIRAGRAADPRRRTQRSATCRTGTPIGDRHDAGRSAYPAAGCRAGSHVPARFRGAERSCAAVAAEDRTDPDAYDRGHFHRRPHRRRTVCQSRPQQLGTLGRSRQCDASSAG